MLDVFKNDAFNVISLTASINKLPFAPSRIGQMGLFASEGVTTTSVVIEEKHGRLALIPTAARGTMPNIYSGDTRHARTFRVPHLPLNAAVMADDVQGVRAFGSEDQVEGVAQVVANKMTGMRQWHETTHEWHRIGALRGVVLDADGTTELYDWFDEFDITETVIEFEFSSDEEMRIKAVEVTEEMEEALGSTAFSGVHAVCGKDFFRALCTCPAAKAAFDKASDGQFFRDALPRGGFEWAGIVWEQYRGKIGNIPFIPDDQARFFPEGVPDLFKQYNAPANFIETVNTVGQPVYAKQEPMKFDVGVELHTQSNPLFICTRPAVLIKGVAVGGTST